MRRWTLPEFRSLIAAVAILDIGGVNDGVSSKLAYPRKTLGLQVALVVASGYRGGQLRWQRWALR
jgi:hypothetical protein